MKVKIHCFEGEWDRKHPELSIKPLIKLLEQLYVSCGNTLVSSHKLCQSINRLSENLKLDGRNFSNKSVQHCLYFAFHGDGNGLWGSAGDGSVSFDEIASSLGQKAAGSIIFFGSCGTRASSVSLATLKARTNARLVVGYAASVDWLKSSMFEMLFFNELCNYQKFGAFVNKMNDTASQPLFSKLKVRMI